MTKVDTGEKHEENVAIIQREVAWTGTLKRGASVQINGTVISWLTGHGDFNVGRIQNLIWPGVE